MDGVRRVGRHGLTLALAIITGAACTDLGGIESRFQIERDAWEALNLRSYDYTLRISCYCLDEVTSPVRVQVRAGGIASLSYVHNGEPVAEAYQGSFPTIDGLFAKLRDAFDSGADSVSVEYDSALHFPRAISIDYVLEMADDEIGYAASDFVDRS